MAGPVARASLVTSAPATLRYGPRCAEPAPGASPSASEAVVRELLAMPQSWAQAIIANDAIRIAAFVTEDWVMVSDTVISPGKKYLALVASGELTRSAMGILGPTRVRILGSTAVLTARITHAAHCLGRRLVADEWTTDVFVRHNGRWLCEIAHDTAVRPSSWPSAVRRGPYPQG